VIILARQSTTLDYSSEPSRMARWGIMRPVRPFVRNTKGTMGEFIRLTAATLLGALISFGTTYYFERRKEQRTERQAKQETDRQLRQALRLVRDELIDASEEIQTARDSHLWWSSPPHDLRLSLWTEHRATLAALLDDHDAWFFITTAYSAIVDFIVTLGMAKEGKAPFSRVIGTLEPIEGSEISSAWDRELRNLNNVIEQALAPLEGLVRPGELIVASKA
jgi:hypothetical protein